MAQLVKALFSITVLMASAGSGAVAQSQAASCPALLKHRHAPLLAGTEESLCRHAGQVILMVNTASRCGYTEQYRDLQKLYDRYRQRGFIVLGFPANAFGQQEPGGNAQIAEFCQANFGVKFPMFAKIETVPLTREPLFADLARMSGSPPKWNFHKYLVSRDGSRVQAFPSHVEPLSKTLTAAVERELLAR